ncbi:MAG: transposase family protein [Psychromonas sp.]|nr:transposase family protein [Alteromonadales bacterium]MCP5078209.1 transposase family protein [Psychromonas sp.]
MLFLKQIETIEDYRADISKEYELADIIFLAVTAIDCGAKG